jgi:hypothetical protein
MEGSRTRGRVLKSERLTSASVRVLHRESPPARNHNQFIRFRNFLDRLLVRPEQNLSAPGSCTGPFGPFKSDFVAQLHPGEARWAWACARRSRDRRQRWRRASCHFARRGRARQRRSSVCKRGFPGLLPCDSWPSKDIRATAAPFCRADSEQCPTARGSTAQARCTIRPSTHFSTSRDATSAGASFRRRLASWRTMS